MIKLVINHRKGGNLLIMKRMTLALTLSLALVIVIINYPSPLLSSLSTRSINSDHENNNKRHCDMELCDSLVSKCTITNRCSCNFKKDAWCAKDCIDCLEEKFGKCCACVDLCPAIEGESHSSHVGDTSQSDQQFFETLTETDDIHGRWNVVTRSTGLQLLHPEHGQIELAYRVDMNKSFLISHDTNLEKLKCTLAFINRHLSMTKCKRSCTTMGASFFRWFHDGCCECVGKYCLNYGIDEPKCLIDIED